MPFPTLQANPAIVLICSKLTVQIHSGHFHADEALATYMLRLLPEYRDAQVVRSRVPDVLESCDIVVDVTGKYDGKKYFDHHQREFQDTFSPEFKTRLSSAGLVYKHFAPSIISQRLGYAQDSPEVELLYKKIYKEFIEALDANDNGILPFPSDIKPAFTYFGISLPSIVGSYNLEWNAEDTSQETEDKQFLAASEVIGKVFVDKLDYYGKSWLPAREIVLRSYNSRKEIDPSGKIIRLERPCPWKDHLFALEEELQIPESELPLYVLYPEGPGKPNWRIQCIPNGPDTFENRKSLPEAWRGVRDEALSEVSGIPGGIFVHASGFTGGNKSYEGVLEMAKKALVL